MWLSGLLPLRGQARLLRDGNVVAFPPGVTEDSVYACARLWAPGAQCTDDGRLLVTPCLQLVGPLRHDETLWRRAAIPAAAATAYAVTDQPRLGHVLLELTGGDLAAGLARRLGGWYRGQDETRWHAGGAEPPEPCVYAPDVLSAGRTTQLLKPCLAALHLADQDDGWYRLESGGVSVIVASDASDESYPLISQQPWFVSWERTAVYHISAADSAGRHQASRAARILRHATGGVLLDDDGFPWTDPAASAAPEDPAF